VGKKKDTICIVILALMALILLLRNCYSFCWSDESLYVENVYRLYQGDVIILDEWNMTMISAYIWLPVFSLWHLLFGNVGVYLFFRCLYTLISLCIAIYVFISLKEYNREGVLIGCITYMIYSRANIMGCSYYNTGLSFWLLAVTVLWDISMDRQK
jgi:hypothetical protein